LSYNISSRRSPAAPSAILVSAVLLAGGTVGLVRAADIAADFEVPPDLSPTALLPASTVTGADYHVVDPVRSDGLMRRYVVDSRFGQFEAYGDTALALRIREVAALTELAKISDVELVAGGVGRGVEGQVETAVGVVAHPVKTITGIPTGIAHLFRGLGDRGEELAVAAKKDAHGASGGGASGAATSYAERYIGVGATERHWYQKFGVDPYTDNQVLRKAIHKNAKVEAAGSFGARFVGIPSIPGIGDARKAMDAIYNEDPATIRARTKATLLGYGLTPDEVAGWQNTLVLSPTRQVLLLSAAAALDGVDGRAELFRHALGLTTDTEAQVYLHSVGLLVAAHRRQALAQILPGVRLPAARRADGHVVVCGAFESVYWTADVARGEAQLRQALPDGATGARELWLAGTISDRARTELRERGWQLQDVSQDDPAPVR
jgi:hypothetical protein